jgi:hypothetical protein
MSLILAQASIFILRLLFANTPLPVSRNDLIERLRQVVHLFSDGELSETRSSTHYVRILVDLCRIIGVELSLEGNDTSK